MSSAVKFRPISQLLISTAIIAMSQAIPLQSEMAARGFLLRRLLGRDLNG